MGATEKNLNSEADEPKSSPRKFFDWNKKSDYANKLILIEKNTFFYCVTTFIFYFGLWNRFNISFTYKFSEVIKKLLFR